MTLTRLLVILASLAPTLTALNFILVPMMSASHILRLGWVGKGLVERGHRVHMIKHHSVPVPSQLASTRIHFVDYYTDETVHFIGTRNCSNMYASIETDPADAVPKLLNFFDRQCEDLLDNEDLYVELNGLGLDFALVDAFSALQCFFALPRRLRIPYAGLGLLPPLETFSTTLQFNYVTPTLPIAMSAYPQTPSFLHRVKQWLIINIMSMITEYRQNTAKLATYLHERPLQTFSDLRRGSSLWLVDSHPIVDVAKPSVPNVVYLGGLTTGQEQALPNHLQRFADSASNGLIVVSFGTVVTHLPDDEFTIILTALNNVTEKVILATPVDIPIELRPHILVEKWIPQSDVLAHANTKLFITHCGASSQHQSIYSAVPMLGIPFQEEQKANAQRMQAKGYGRFLDRSNLNALTIQSEIKALKSDPVIRANVIRASKIMRDRALEPEAEAAYWLEHVARFGGKHLSSYTERLRWYEVLMLDLIAFFFCLSTLPIVIVFLAYKMTSRITRIHKFKTS